jgi:hypothetical protein
LFGAINDVVGKYEDAPGRTVGTLNARAPQTHLAMIQREKSSSSVGFGSRLSSYERGSGGFTMVYRCLPLLLGDLLLLSSRSNGRRGDLLRTFCEPGFQ